MKKIRFLLVALALAGSPSWAGEYIGRLGSNPFCGDCSANPFALMNNQFYPYSLKNSFGGRVRQGGVIFWMA